MRSTEARALLRRSNPLVMFAVGILAGAMVVAIAKPAKQSTVTPGALGPGGSSIATTLGGETSPGAGVATGAPTGGSNGAASATGPGAGVPGGGLLAVQGSSNGCPGNLSSGVRGVTNKTIKIGFALPDMGVLAAAVNIGNPQADVDAALAGMRKDGRLPVCGRDIVPVYRTFNVLDPSQSRAACDGFADQDHVFAVISLFAFQAADCVTQEKKTLLMDSGSSETLADFAGSPLLFTSDPPIDASLLNVAYWAVRTGLLDGKSIGVYYNQNGPGGADPPGALVAKDLVDVLTRLGHPVKDVVVSNTQLSGAAPTAADPNDAIAVQKFKTDNIQVVFPLEFSVNFFQQAQAQGYHAQWLVYSTAMASDAVTSTDPSSLDGALGLLWEHVGEAASGVPQNPQTRACFRYYTQAGNSQPPSTDSPAGLTLRESCDPLDLFVRAFGAAGNNLTAATLIAGMEALRNIPEGYDANQTFGSGKHWGAVQDRVVQWHAACSCWKVAGPFAPLYWQP